MPHSYISVRAVETRAVVTYSSSDMSKIYGFPAPPSGNTVIGVISLGGGLFGTLDSSGILRNGDVQQYWLSQGISAENHPTVVIVGVDGAVNMPSANDGGSTIENTVDVETVGSCCPTSKLTIILYIAPNTFNNFYNIFQYAINTPVVVNGIPLKPTIISCSWGISELNTPSYLLTNLNNLFKTAVQKGINICVASGDNGSGNGGPGINVDFPGSSPHVVCCGGTTLVCIKKIYDASTVETVWNNNPTTSATGGGISKVFGSPTYQSALAQSKRVVPDIALNADPNTGVRFFINGSSMIVGGTSIAAPAFAAFIACCKVSSFINPILYSLPRSCFYDIVSGNNGAYSAGVGFDKCSGLGSINGAVLSAYITDNIVAPTSISISPSSLNISTPTPVQLTASILPTNTTDKTITWTSSNPAIAAVSSTGLVTPINSGSVTITATTITGRTTTIPVSISIVIQATNISISPSSLNLSRLIPVQLTASILPTNTTNKTVTWTSSNPAIATVSSTGIVTPIISGEVKITATTTNGRFSTITASILQIKSTSISSSIVLPSTTSILQLTASIQPTTTSNKTVVWSSSNRSVATVSSSGLVTGISAGNAVIISTAQDTLKTSSINITVPISSNKIASSTNILKKIANRNRKI